MAAQLVIMPALFAGLLIGLYEAILLHRDVSIPTHRFGHMTHALVFAVIASFAAFNVDFVLAVIPQLKAVPLISNPHVFRAAIGLIAAIKIHAVSAAIQGGGVSMSVGLGEKWSHSIVVGALTAIAPYLYPLISPSLPAYLRLPK